MKKLAVFLVLASMFFAAPSSAQPLPGQSIVVDKTFHVLLLFDGNGNVKATYPVGTGRIDKTTKEGQLHIIRKIIDPTWNPLNPWDFEQQYGKTWPFPPYIENHRNPLGTRFMHLSWEDYGIHGTKEPLLIGRNVSSGCVRMHIQDVEGLFVKVPIGTPVLIKSDENINPKVEEVFSAWWGLYDVVNLTKRIRTQKGE